MSKMITLVIEKYNEITDCIALDSICELKGLVDIIENMNISVRYDTKNLENVTALEFIDFVELKYSGINGTITLPDSVFYVFNPERYLTEVEILEMVNT